MGFLDSYKRLEKLCGEVMNDDRRITAYIEEMNKNIAEIAKIELSRVNVAATTTEKLGFEGREEGISAQATVMLVK